MATRLESSRTIYQYILRLYGKSNAAHTFQARLRVEREVREALNAMTGYLAGSYGKMDFNPHDGRDFMIKDQHLIVKCDE